ncbi:MAG: YggS family pyridoxal phosphate-dependent enzyme [Candidatus Dormiibacterota bacterium]
MSAADRLAEVRVRIAAAAERAGRTAGEVELVAASKYASVEQVIELAEAGQRLFGENRVQEAIPKMAAVSMAVHDPLRWHMIGHLQRNKVRQAAGPFAMIESVDSVRLAEAVAQRATEDEMVVPALLEVNIAGDPAKFGFGPDEVRAAYPLLRQLGGLEVQGLMTMGVLEASAAAARAHYAALRRLKEELDATGDFSPLRHLSMGMSADLEVAIEERATIVRVGTALFGSHHDHHHEVEA